MADEKTNIYKYKGNELDQDLLIRNLEHNVEGYVKSRGWDESKQNEFYDAYRKYRDAISSGRMSSDIDGSLLDSAGELDNGKANYRDANGNVISSDAYDKLKKRKKRNITQDFYPHRAVASYVNLIAGGLYDKLNKTPKEEEEPQAFDITTHGLWTGYLNYLNPYPGGEIDYEAYWAKDPYVEGTGRPTTGRATHLSQYITDYLADLDKNYSNYDFSGTQFRSFGNYKQQLKELQKELGNGWDFKDRSLMGGLGVGDLETLNKLFTTDEKYVAPNQTVSLEPPIQETPIGGGDEGTAASEWDDLTDEDKSYLEQTAKSSYDDWVKNETEPQYGPYIGIQKSLSYTFDKDNAEETKNSFWLALENALDLGADVDLDKWIANVNPTTVGPYMGILYDMAHRLGEEEFNDIFYKIDSSTSSYPISRNNQGYVWRKSYNPTNHTVIVYYPNLPRTVRVHVGGIDQNLSYGFMTDLANAYRRTRGQSSQPGTASPSFEFKKEGGTLRMYDGGNFLQYAKNAQEKAAEMKADPKNAVIGKGDIAHAEWSTAEKMRLASIAADVVALADPEAFSSLALGLGSDIANLSADIKSGYGFWNTAGNAAMNFGMTALSAIPAAGQVVSGGKALKTLVKLAPKLIKYASWAASAGMIANLDEIMQSLKKVTKSGVEGRMTVEDWRNIAMVVQLALGRTKAHLGKKEVNKKYNIATGKEASQGGPAFTKGKKLLLEDNNGNLVEQNFTHPSVVEAIQNAKTPAELNALLASLPEYKNFHVPTESIMRTLRFSNNPNYKWYKPWTYKTKEASTIFRNGAVSDMMDMTNLRRAYQQGQFDNWFGRVILGKGKGHMQPYFLRNARTPAADSRDLETLRGNGLIPESRRLEDFKSRARAASGPLGPVVRNTPASTTAPTTTSTTPPTSTTGTKSKGTSFDTSTKPKVPRTSGNPSRPLATMDENLLLSKAEEYLKTEIKKGTFDPATTEHSESWWELLARNPKVTAADLIELGIWKQGGILSYITKTPKFKLGGNFNKGEQNDTSVSPNIIQFIKGGDVVGTREWAEAKFKKQNQEGEQEVTEAPEINITEKVSPWIALDTNYEFNPMAESAKYYGLDYISPQASQKDNDYYTYGVHRSKDPVSGTDIGTSDATNRAGSLDVQHGGEDVDYEDLERSTNNIMGRYSANSTNRITDVGNFVVTWLRDPKNANKTQFNLLTDYNNLVDSIYDFQGYMAGLDKKYIDDSALKGTPIKDFNQTHKRLYGIANTPGKGYYGYDVGTEGIYGTATALRGADRTDSEVTMDFSGFDLSKLSEQEQARFKDLTKGLIKDTTGRYYINRAPKKSSEKPGEEELDKTKRTKLEDIQSPTAKTSKWSTLSGALTDMLPNSLAVGRYLAARQLNKRLLHKMPILLNDPMEAFRWTEGNQNAIQGGYQAAGALSHYASQPLTANGAEQTAAMLEALDRGNYYINKGYEQNDADVKTSTEANWNQARANQQSRHETAAKNRENLFQGRTDWLTRRDAKWRADQASLDALLGQFETQFRDRNAENKTYREAVQKASIYNTVVADLANNNINATPDEQALLNDLLSGTRKYTQLSSEEKATYNRISKEINEEVTRQMAGLKGLNYTALHLNGATSYTPDYLLLRSGGVFAGDSEKVVIQKLRNKVQKMQTRQKHLEAQLRAYEKDMDRARKSASDYIKGQKKSK